MHTHTPHTTTHITSYRTTQHAAPRIALLIALPLSLYTLHSTLSVSGPSVLSVSLCSLSLCLCPRCSLCVHAPCPLASLSLSLSLSSLSCVCVCVFCHVSLAVFSLISLRFSLRFSCVCLTSLPCRFCCSPGVYICPGCSATVRCIISSAPTTPQPDSPPP